MTCIACGGWPCDTDHIRSRGSGGDNHHSNLWPLCRTCHIEKHSIGLKRFAERHPPANKELISKGWYYDDYLGKWRRDLDWSSGKEKDR